MAFTMACFPPTEMITSEGPYSRPYLFLRRWQTASRSSGKAGGHGVLGPPLLGRLDARFLDVGGGVEIGLSNRERDDVFALPQHFLVAIMDCQRERRSEPANSIG